MEKFSTRSEYKEQLDKLWNDAISNGIPMADRGYSVQDEINFGSLLFVGLNPAYKNDTHVIENEVGVIYNNEAVVKLPYFTKFPALASAANLNWHHIDLFFVRETNQNIFKSLFFNNDQRVKPFLIEQLSISKEIKVRSKPKIIVVVNAFAGEMFGPPKNTEPQKNTKSPTNNIFGNRIPLFTLEFDNVIGTYRIKAPHSLENTPVFLSGMLTGQRALDNGSLKRLEWHIRFVLEKMNS